MTISWAFLCYWVVFSQRQEAEYPGSCSHGEGKGGGDKHDVPVNVQVLAVMWCWARDLWLAETQGEGKRQQRRQQCQPWQGRVTVSAGGITAKFWCGSEMLRLGARALHPGY